MLLIRTAGGWFSMDRSPSPPSWLPPVLGSTSQKITAQWELYENLIPANATISFMFLYQHQGFLPETSITPILQASLEIPLNVAFRTEVHQKKNQIRILDVDCEHSQLHLTRNSILMLPHCFGSSTSHPKQDSSSWSVHLCIFCW